MKRYRTIGILGGMGPEATAELYKRIIALYQDRYGAADDSDYPNIIINSLPVDDMLNDLVSKRDKISQQVCSGAKVLQEAGADFIVIPCNTAMIFRDEIKNAVTVPVLNTIDVVIQSANSLSLGLLASQSTVVHKLYERGENTNKLLYPNQYEQQLVDRAIINVMRGNRMKVDIRNLERISKSLQLKGAERVVLGCTELPLLLAEEDQVYLDSIKILAAKTVDCSAINLDSVFSDDDNDL